MKVLKIERDLFGGDCFIYIIGGFWQSRVYNSKEYLEDVIAEYILQRLNCQDDDVTFSYNGELFKVTDINSDDFSFKIGDNTFIYPPEELLEG